MTLLPEVVTKMMLLLPATQPVTTVVVESPLGMGTSEDTLLRRVQKASLGSLTSALVESHSG